MTFSPRLGYTELEPAETTPPEAVNEIGRYVEAFATRCVVKDRDLVAQPASPVDGDRYLLPTTPTGTNWAGQGGKIALFINTAWVFLAPKEGFEVEVEDEDASFTYRGGAWVAGSGGTRPIGFFFTTTPTASEVLLLYTAVENITLADDFAGALGDVGTNPTSSFVMGVQVNGGAVGTITISTAGAISFVTTGAAVSLVPGDQLKVVGPGTADATCANVSITLKGAL